MKVTQKGGTYIKYTSFPSKRKNVVINLQEYITKNPKIFLNSKSKFGIIKKYI